MNVGDVRLNLYQPQQRASAPTAATGRGGYATENVGAVSAISAVRSATQGSSFSQQVNDLERQELLGSADNVRGQNVDIFV